MNYRARQIRSLWAKDRAQLQQDIINLQNSAEVQVVAQLEDKLREKQTALTRKQALLDNLVSLLGKNEVNSLADLQGFLQGKTLKEIFDQHQQDQAQFTEREAWYLEKHKDLKKDLKAQAETIANLKKDQEQKNQAIIGLNRSYEKLETRTSAQIREQGQTIELTQGKVKDLESQLLGLAQQKIANKKEAKILVEQLEQDWTQKQSEWEQQSQQQQDHFAQQLAQTRADYQQEIRELKTQLLNEKEQALDQTKTLAEQKLTEAQEVFDHYREAKEQELQAKTNKISQLEQWSQGQHERIRELETLEQNLSQEKANLSQELQEQKTFYQQQIRTEQETNQIQQETINDLNQQINQLNQILTNQKIKARQLLRTRERLINQNPNQDNISQSKTQITQEITLLNQILAHDQQ
jgi:hypothetical protein